VQTCCTKNPSLSEVAAGAADHKDSKKSSNRAPYALIREESVKAHLTILMEGEDVGLVNRQLLLRKICGLDWRPDHIELGDFEHLPPRNLSDHLAPSSWHLASNVSNASSGSDLLTSMENAIEGNLYERGSEGLVRKLVRKHRQPSLMEEDVLMTVGAEGTMSAVPSDTEKAKALMRHKGSKIRRTKTGVAMEIEGDATITGHLE